MFITDLKKGFYQKLVHKHVLLLASFDVDSVCTCKILQALFRCDQVRYTLVPVGGVADLESAFKQQCGDQIDIAVFINCGASLDLWDLLKPPDHITFFVLDSNRPVHLENLYDAETGDNRKVMVLVHEDDDLDIPRFEEYFLNEDMSSDEEDGDADEDDDDISEGDSPTGNGRRKKRPRLTEDDLIRRAERRERRVKFVEERKNTLFDYYMRSSFARPSSILVYELAHVMTRGTNELLWWSIIGYTDYLLQAKISMESYVSLLADLHKQVTTLNRNIVNDDEDAATSKDQMKISFLDKEVLLSVYRRWTLYDSLEHSLLPACQFQVWNHAITKLKGFLVDLGIPLNESTQTFTNMDLHYQQNLRSWICEKCEKDGKYKLDGCVYASFEAKYGYLRTYGAADVACAVMALLEIGVLNTEPSTIESRFLLALDCLSRRHYGLIEQGIGTYKVLLKSVLERVKSLVNLGQVIPMGHFLQAHINEAPSIFQTPAAMRWLARFLLHAYAAEMHQRRRKNAKHNLKAISLVLSMTRPEPNADWCFCIGIPPINEEKENPCSLFGAVFSEVEQGMEDFVKRPFFDPSIIEIRKDIRMRFFDKLKSRLSAG